VGDEIEADVARQEAEARAVAAAGAEHARRAGFDAEGMAVRHPGSAAAALEQTVDELRPDLVVLGSRGLTGLKALLKGSTSHHVGTHAHAPVLIVPPEPEEARGDAASAGP
jgi:nucleotide-binding universal stress UspA family protein